MITRYELKDGALVKSLIDAPEHTPSAEELKAQRLAEIDELKLQLASTDYKAIKFAEGWLTAEEYEPIKAMRQSLRDRINTLESMEGEGDDKE